ncbi:TNF receptor-associated factor 3-like isoform X2 [Hydractinia symbiolongicarpus]|nr:TNF receptor-associated factor 3-like isoform X2 [Hydractinia symbiolongicarpus]XP_057315098.1 TNF receptor-associated factor 3-like isoform X2 [Hydractinia symbiolongicarpus]
MVLESISRQSSTEAVVERRHSGYEVLLVDPLPERLKCPLCKKLMRNPIQTYRGELACEYCYQRYQNDINVCPIDHEATSPESTHRDKFQEQVIDMLPCYCTNKQRGCDWRGTVKEAENHQAECQFGPVKCCFCGENVHDRSLKNDHLKNCTALIERKICIYESIGCKYKVTNVEEHVQHLLNDSYQHVFLQQKETNKQKEIAQHLKEELTKKTIAIKEIEENLNDNVSSLKEKISKLLKNAEDSQKAFLHINTQLQKLSNQMEHIKSAGNNDLNNEVNTSLMTDINEKIATLDLKQQLGENTTYDGKILWKIDNFSYRMQQAVTGRVTALHSAPCFTSRYGYKFCGRLYLNGDGMGKCSHVSLFMVLMKSQYDNLLDWPFNKHMMFRLINQEDYSKSIQESFLPDGASSSFQKPTREMNVAAGCPLFVSKEKLLNEGFVKDDAIFIEISAK